MSKLTLLEHQFSDAQRIIKAQEQLIDSIGQQLNELTKEHQELLKEVEAWRAHAKAYEEWFTTTKGVGIPRLKNQHQTYRAAVEARQPYYQAAVSSAVNPVAKPETVNNDKREDSGAQGTN